MIRNSQTILSFFTSTISLVTTEIISLPPSLEKGERDLISVVTKDIMSMKNDDNVMISMIQAFGFVKSPWVWHAKSNRSLVRLSVPLSHKAKTTLPNNPPQNSVNWVQLNKLPCIRNMLETYTKPMSCQLNLIALYQHLFTESKYLSMFFIRKLTRPTSSVDQLENK